MPLAFAIQCPWALRSRSWFNSPTSSKGQRQILMMGGGPRTFPGGVSKWQWKKMQDKKAKQLLKARLVRERQLYEMRKRAELKAADLQKPWEKTSAAPTLFAVTADDQLQAMADRFVKRGAIDLWTDKDGPDSRFITVDGKPSARVFPRNAFHSTQPYTIAPKDYPPLRESNRCSMPLLCHSQVMESPPIAHMFLVDVGNTHTRLMTNLDTPPSLRQGLEKGVAAAMGTVNPLTEDFPSNLSPLLTPEERQSQIERDHQIVASYGHKRTRSRTREVSHESIGDPSSSKVKRW